MIICKKCGSTDIGSHSGGKNNPRRSKCRPCWAEYERLARLRRKYDMTAADYEALYIFQGGRCVICFQPETATRNGKIKNIAVHHDHTTGKVVALVCATCNTGMGNLKDDPILLHRAAALMEQARTTE